MNVTLVPRERSFRDPGGFVFRSGSRLLRAIEPSAFEILKQFLASTAARNFIAARQLVITNFPDPLEFFFDFPADYHLAEHECIPFPSFPAENARLYSSAADCLCWSPGSSASGWDSRP